MAVLTLLTTKGLVAPSGPSLGTTFFGAAGGGIRLRSRLGLGLGLGLFGLRLGLGWVS